PPRDATERALADAWSEVLGLPRVGVDDNFFELGGDSILAIRVVARARRAGVAVTPQQVFQHPTVARLARHATAAARPDDAEAVTRRAAPGPAPRAPAQACFFSRAPADPHHYAQGFRLSLRRRVAPDVLARALAAVVARHDAFRLRFREVDGAWTQWLEP